MTCQISQSEILKLQQLEIWIDFISAELDILDPANSIEAQKIEFNIMALQSLLSSMESEVSGKHHLSLVS